MIQHIQAGRAVAAEMGILRTATWRWCCGVSLTPLGADPVPGCSPGRELDVVDVISPAIVDTDPRECAAVGPAAPSMHRGLCSAKHRRNACVKPGGVVRDSRVEVYRFYGMNSETHDAIVVRISPLRVTNFSFRAKPYFR